ncbi:MAG: Butyryl-CoA dehydrogenase [Syntrophus sp. SKADARSKE-3]|nr:Butyryl-CoA dehydrogenase [Syntrophus sp. SKADARSKE-3]
MSLNPLVDSRDVRFVLFEMLGLDKISRFEAFEGLDRDVFEDTLNLAEKIAMDQFYSTYAEGDKIGLKFNPDTNEVKVPESFHKGFNAYTEAGFHVLSFPQDEGGMGMPTALSFSAQEYFNAGNTSLGMYCSSLTGTAHLLIAQGSEEIKKMFLGPMISGEWGGTMCLTEPSAGSDVGALKSKAVRQADGTYLISGQKIFISNGEHDMCTNIIHPVLARIEGDPPGTKGISIFIVPKFLVNPDGSLGARNDMACTGVEHKMGLKANATSTLNFGENGKCVGYLLGKEREGMKIMFQLMNEARTFTGLQSLAVSSAAYMHAVTYARTRVQGEILPGMPKVPIIEHTDVKRMLLYMKSMVEGMRMLTYYLCYNQDVMHASKDAAECEEATAFVELLTPIAKAGNSDAGWLVTAEAIQVYGGYGYCQEYPVEQYARDVKVFSVYEGTNAIQSLDLTMRKILMNPNYRNYTVFKNRLAATAAKARGIVDEKYIAPVELGLQKLDEVIETMKAQLAGQKIFAIFANATMLQQSIFMLVLAWLHLESLTITIPKRNALVGDLKGAERNKFLADNQEAAYYAGRVLSSQFYIAAEFPKFFGKIGCIVNNDAAPIVATSDIFTGALRGE